MVRAVYFQSHFVFESRHSRVRVLTRPEKPIYFICRLFIFFALSVIDLFVSRVFLGVSNFAKNRRKVIGANFQDKQLANVEIPLSRSSSLKKIYIYIYIY